MGKLSKDNLFYDALKLKGPPLFYVAAREKAEAEACRTVL